VEAPCQVESGRDLQRVLTAVQAQADAAGKLDWLAGVDSTIMRAHQHAASAHRVSGARSNHT
jgi:hypothetical protein